MGAYVGRDVLVEFSIAPESAVRAGLTYQTLGMMRGKELKASWDTVDTTGDKSAGATRSSLATFKNVEFSGDCVSYDDAVHNQLTFEAHFVNAYGNTATQRQPKVWLRITYPNKVYEGPFILTECSNSNGYDAESTLSIAAKSNGDVTLTPL